MSIRLLRIISAQNEDGEVDLNMNLKYRRRLIRPAFLFFTFVICLGFVAGGQSAFAQTIGSATLRGTVKDPKGAVVAGATVTMINERTRDERKATTNNEGGYVFSAVSPGSYSLKVEARGFKTILEPGVAVETSTTRAFDVAMQLGQPTETVTVTATAEQIQT